jgi:hypothetical protein
VRLTIAHRYDFRDDRKAIGDDLILPEAWDAARDTSGAFGLPESRDEWERLAGQPQLERRARDLVAIARRLAARSLCSHGAGTGALELNVHRLAPDLALTCTDYAPRATERLRRLFPEATVIAHDLAEEEPPPADLHVMHRIDTELDTATWKRVFARFEAPIVVVPTLLLDAERVLKEVALRVLRPRASRAGWMRTEDAFRALWSASHSDEILSIGDQRAFLLTPVRR